MPELNIQDFGQPPEEEINSEELSKEEIENFYKSQIEKLRKEYEEKIKKSFEEGYKQGYEEAQKEIIPQLQNQFQSELEKKLKQKEEEISLKYNELKLELTKFLNEIYQKYKEHIDFIDELILSVIEEILYYMYVDPNNARYVAEEIIKLLEDLKNPPEVIVEISPQLKEYISPQQKNIKVIVKDELEGGDFIIKVENAQFENRFKEKLKILKDEIKREIKKNSPL